MANKPRLRGSNCLLGIDAYNSCFTSYFGISVMDVLNMSKHCDMQLLYYYGLRRICGMSVREVSNLLGYPNTFSVTYGLKFCCKKLCLFDASYDVIFFEKWHSFRCYCRLFRRPLSSAERSKRFRDNQRNKKKRAKAKGKK